MVMRPMMTAIAPAIRTGKSIKKYWARPPVKPAKRARPAPVTIKVATSELQE